MLTQKVEKLRSLIGDGKATHSLATHSFLRPSVPIPPTRDRGTQEKSGIIRSHGQAGLDRGCQRRHSHCLQNTPTQKREDYTNTLASPFFPFPNLPSVLPLVETSQNLLPWSLGNVVPGYASRSGKGGRVSDSKQTLRSMQMSTSRPLPSGSSQSAQNAARMQEGERAPASTITPSVC